MREAKFQKNLLWFLQTPWYLQSATAAKVTATSSDGHSLTTTTTRLLDGARYLAASRRTIQRHHRNGLVPPAPATTPCARPSAQPRTSPSKQPATAPQPSP